MPALAPEQKAYSVSQLTREIRSLLEGRIGSVWVEGEISNLRRQQSGHQYFSLKDDAAQLRCVMFRASARRESIPLDDGMQVQAFGDLSVYEAQGQYQLVVRTIQPKGMGELQARFEALKRRLDAEGLFDAERKQKLPRFPQTLLLVTSPTSAAIRDMLQILHRRAPWVRILVAPVRVQGEGAGEEIAAAIRSYTSGPVRGLPRIDTVIVGRGGGSIEDLWSFNEEVVARAIAACPIPIVSAVGHEIDFTIADFVADLRAPTPSAAAELVVPDRAEILGKLDSVALRLSGVVRTRLEHGAREVALLAQSGAFREPRRVLADRLQRVDELALRVREATMRRFGQDEDRLVNAARMLEMSRPDRALRQRAERLENLSDRIDRATRRRLEQLQQRLEGVFQMLRSLGPDSVLHRGYSLSTNERGEVVFSADQLKKGDLLRTRFGRGMVESEVRAIEDREPE